MFPNARAGVSKQALVQSRFQKRPLVGSKKTNSELVNVFIPTTPNATSGFLIMFPKNEIKYLDMSFEEASRFIVSAGTSDNKKN